MMYDLGVIRRFQMITIPELVAQALGSFLTSETKSRFGDSQANLAEIFPLQRD
jgi:hypothetical protein